MTWKILAIASTVAAVSAYAPAAQACISCEYVPPVVNSGSSSSTYQAQPSRRERSYSEKSEKRERRERATKKVTSKSKRETASEETAAATPAAPQKVAAETEHSSITTTGSSIANQVKEAVTAPEKFRPQNENSTFSTAAPETDKAQPPKHVEQATADKNLGCKKFFPSSGLTLSVPCE